MTALKWTVHDAMVTLRLPPGSADAHLHIYDARFPYDPQASLRPGPATVADYRALQRHLGTSRCVIVQPSSYGTDNRCLADALEQMGPDARGVAVIDQATSDTAIRRLHEVGVRGIRFNLIRPAGAHAELMQTLARRIEPLGWHVQVHTLADAYPALAPVLRKLPVPVVIDHLGRLPPNGDPLQHPAWDALRRLVDHGRAWVKISGAYHDTLVGAPSYSDTGRVARAWLEQAPERTVWGTDWPHPSAVAGEKTVPDDGQLLNLVGEWLPPASSLRRLLVENPARLYGFVDL